MDFDKLKRKLLCRYCEPVHIMQAEAYCIVPDCVCGEEKPLRTILEWYAFLYRMLNNINYIEYRTIAMSEPEEAGRIRARVEREWTSHIRPRQQMYAFKITIGLQEETGALLHKLLTDASSPKELLLRMMALLLVLDKQVLLVKGDYQNSYPEELPIKTPYGELIPLGNSVLQNALAIQRGYMPLVDPNYLQLSKEVDSFHLAHLHYPYYRVKHMRVNTPLYNLQQMMEFRVGFLPGKFDISTEYAIKTEELDADALIPFTFTGLKDQGQYEARVMQLFEELLSQEPDVLILPELFTPSSLREKLVQQLKEWSAVRSGKGLPTKPYLLLTGSFHELRDGKLYNYAEVVNGEGRTIRPLYKMNRFILKRDEEYEDQLAPFKQDDGVEMNAYDRREIILLETSLGRMAFLICIDFLSSSLEQILLDRKVDIIFVMAMTPSPSGGKFLRRMQDLAELNGAAVFLCNNYGKEHGDETKRKEEARSVVSLPGFRNVFLAGDEAQAYTLNDMLAKIVRPANPRKADADKVVKKS